MILKNKAQILHIYWNK